MAGYSVYFLGFSLCMCRIFINLVAIYSNQRNLVGKGSLRQNRNL
uniref:Uncharacterized protein n=1 Tax=Rhizophora mucronata TaxID=61149 RepID=A0A2P2PWF3_RHIMU